MNSSQALRLAAVVVSVISAVLLTIFVVRSVSSSMTSVGASNDETRDPTYVYEELPRGVTQYSVDSIGAYVARSAYLIDMTSDRTPNDALLRHSGRALNAGLVDRLRTDSRSSMFVSGLPLDDLKSEGVTSWSTSAATVDADASAQTANTAHRRYSVETRPIYETGKTGPVYRMTVDIDFTRHGSLWFVDDYVSR